MFTALDNKRLTLFVVGVLLFAYSAQLSHNLLFYYLCGITIGVTTSFFIIILFISRFIPKVRILLKVIFVVIILFFICFIFRNN